MRVVLAPTVPGDGTVTAETVHIPDDEVATLLGVLLPFARLYSSTAAASPTRRERERVRLALMRLHLEVGP